MIDVLKSERRIKSAPHVHRVKHFDDVFSPVIQMAIAEQKSQAAQRQIFLVIARNAVGNKSEPGAIVPFCPQPFPLRPGAEFDGVVDFGVRVGLMLAFVPSPATEKARPIA